MEHKSENRTCQNCKKDFTIEPDDFLFYEKIKVPPPTFCPHCRLVRRLIWRDERSLYKRRCDLCEKNIISMYDDKVIFPVYCPDCYKSDKWGAENFGQNYDFEKPFFEQWKGLFNKVPRQSVWHVGNCKDTDYTNFVDNSKNVYLSSSVIYNSEDVFFSNNVDASKMIVDSYTTSKSELVYENINSNKNYNCQYSYWSSNCVDCNFILDCNNCQDCFGCVSLQNKRYCILNEQYTKEQYEQKMKDFNISNHSFVENFKNEFWKFSLKFPRKYGRIINTINSSGDEIRDSKNSLYTFNSYGMENVKYAYRCPPCKECMDVCHLNAEMVYEHAFGGSFSSSNLKFVIGGAPSVREAEYIDFCSNSHNIFGCISLKNKQYCILNKQYTTKEEYFEMVEKIKKQMIDMPYVDKKGRVFRYGEFFPYELCPFGYNEAVINDHFPLSKEEILERGYPYKEKVENKYTITLRAKDIPDDIKDVDDSILNEVIECEVSGKAFKITPFELQFYRRMNIPIPHLHPDERYKKRLALRNPMILYTRQCMKDGCNNTFETTYAPDRPEIVYCDRCYKQEVY